MAAQSDDFAGAETILTKDLCRIDNYFKTWRLKPNITKTEVSCFHLSNRQANYVPQVQFRGHILKFNPHPKYLGVSLDRSLTYSEHIRKTSAKIKTRNNILHKLTGTSWGPTASTLRTTALALVYPVAEYCCPVWLNSAHTKKIDTQLNDTMRTISGTIQSTPLEWLPVLSNIPPPHLRRQMALKKEWIKCCDNPLLPIHQDCLHEDLRLKSRNPPWLLGKRLAQDEFHTNTAWRDGWAASNPDRLGLISDPVVQPPGFNLPRKIWTSLNRIRTQHGRCNSWKHKWKITNNPYCDCSDVPQTVLHITTKCPLRRFSGTIKDIHEASDEAVSWITKLDIQL